MISRLCPGFSGCVWGWAEGACCDGGWAVVGGGGEHWVDLHQFGPHSLSEDLPLMIPGHRVECGHSQLLSWDITPAPRRN